MSTETDCTERIGIGPHELEFIRIPAARRGSPTLVFLHEGLGSAALWRSFPRALAERTGCGAVVYSRYGNGFSTPLAEHRTARYMHDEALSALPALLEALGLGDVVLIGQSDGASIALIYTAQREARVRALVLEAPHVFVEDLSVRSIAAMKQEYEKTDLRGRLARYHADVDRTFYGWNDVWLSPEFRSWNVESYVAHIRAPMLAIQGLDDEYGTLAQLEAISRKAAVPIDRMLLAHCGHAPHRDRAALVESAVGAWLEERLCR